jgi:hypothetical protein
MKHNPQRFCGKIIWKYGWPCYNYNYHDWSARKIVLKAWEMAQTRLLFLTQIKTPVYQFPTYLPWPSILPFYVRFSTYSSMWRKLTQSAAYLSTTWPATNRLSEESSFSLRVIHSWRCLHQHQTVPSCVGVWKCCKSCHALDFSDLCLFCFSFYSLQAGFEPGVARDSR